MSLIVAATVTMLVTTTATSAQVAQTGQAIVRDSLLMLRTTQCMAAGSADDPQRTRKVFDQVFRILEPDVQAHEVGGRWCGYAAMRVDR